MFLESIKEIIDNNKTANFIFIGDYTRDELALFARLTNVYVFEKQQRQVIIPVQHKADMLLLCSGNIEGGTSGKLYEYIFSHKPILNIGGVNTASEIISKTKTGETFLESDLDGINKYIEQVRTGKYKINPQNLNEFTRRSQIKKLAEAINNLEMEN